MYKILFYIEWVFQLIGETCTHKFLRVKENTMPLGVKFKEQTPISKGLDLIYELNFKKR